MHILSGPHGMILIRNMNSSAEDASLLLTFIYVTWVAYISGYHVEDLVA